MFQSIADKVGLGRSDTTSRGGNRSRSDIAVELDNVEIVYNTHFLAVQGISMEVDHGSIVALMGPNGAGKSTILKMISGIGGIERGEVSRGSVTVNGVDATNASTQEMVSRGVTHVLEGRRVFEKLTVEKNLRCGLYRKEKRLRPGEGDFDLAFEYFPQLEEILDVKAGYVSGGQQQMLVIARALLHEADLLLLDEPSFGLAPQLVESIFDKLNAINKNEDLTMVIADQNAKRLLDLADYGYVMENGQIAFDGTSEELKNREEIKEFYLGTKGDDRYAEIKHYKIRKRWA
jgi:branched-chain amino acid transport system ATP-binding protein